VRLIIFIAENDRLPEGQGSSERQDPGEICLRKKNDLKKKYYPQER